MKALFSLGKLVATPSIVEKVSPAYFVACLKQHMCGQWGMLDCEDKAANDAAVKHGMRILSSYPLPDDPENFWIITEADRSITTALLPAEY